MDMTLDNATGAFNILLTSTSAMPFANNFRVGIILWNPTSGNPAAPAFGGDFNLAVPVTTITLTGIHPFLLSWKAGDQVATSTQGGIGSPPGATFFSTARIFRWCLPFLEMKSLAIQQESGHLQLSQSRRLPFR